MMQAQKISAMDDVESIVKVGTEVEIGDPLIVFGLGDTGDKSVDNFLKAFQTKESNDVLDNAKRVFRAKHAGKVVDVRMYTTKSMDKLSPSLYKIFDEYFKANIQRRKILDKYDKTNSVYKLDTLYSLPTEPLKGTSIKGQTCDVLIEIFIEHSDEASVGDKLAVYGASKQVLSEVVPEGMEPYTETRPDEEVSLFVTPSAILKRMIPSLLVTASGNKVLVELKRSIARIWNENS
jgi:DNA-directed RNA polymerase beta subunit